MFIAKTDSGIKTLADMKGKQISFGSQSSTSGHLMPRSFLLAANINPEKDFRRIAYSGAHDATIASVVSGKVDAAALDITVWRKFVTENKVDTKAVDVFYTTPGYYNYNWSVHADMPADLRNRLQKALLDIDPASPEGAEILKLNRATRYIPTTPDNYKGIEAAARARGLDFVPLARELYFLVTLEQSLEQPQVKTLLGLLRSEAWRAQLNALPGYAAENSGEVLSLRRVLPWWSYRKPKA